MSLPVWCIVTTATPAGNGRGAVVDLPSPVTVTGGGGGGLVATGGMVGVGSRGGEDAVARGTLGVTGETTVAELRGDAKMTLTDTEA